MKTIAIPEKRRTHRVAWGQGEAEANSERQSRGNLTHWSLKGKGFWYGSAQQGQGLIKKPREAGTPSPDVHRWKSGGRTQARELQNNKVASHSRSVPRGQLLLPVQVTVVLAPVPGPLYLQIPCV